MKKTTYVIIAAIAFVFLLVLGVTAYMASRAPNQLPDSTETIAE